MKTRNRVYDDLGDGKSLEITGSFDKLGYTPNMPVLGTSKLQFESPFNII